MKGSGKMIDRMGSVPKYGLMEQITLENLKKEINMVKADLNIVMDLIILEAF